MRLDQFFKKAEERWEIIKEKFIRFCLKHKWTKWLLKEYMVAQRRDPDKTKNRRMSLFMVMSIFGVLALLIIGRMVYVEATHKVDNVSLNEQTRKLYQGERTIYAKRGTIYDRNGTPIAEDAMSYSVYAVLDKNYVGVNNEKLYVQNKDKEEVAKVLHKYLDIDEDLALKQLNKKSNQVEFGTQGKGITLEKRNEVKKALKKKGIKGIYFTEHPDRIYPNGVFASHLIGYTKTEEHKDGSTSLKGIMGIESAYNKDLSGENGSEVYQMSVGGNPIPGTVHVTKKAKDGKDIYTTLDANLQVYLEGLMTKVQKTFNPEAITAVLMDAKTGEIIAASQRPTFNPETKAGLDNKDTKSIWQNLLVQNSYEPGSVMKPFTVAAAIQDGVFNANAYYQAGSINVDGTKIDDWDYYAPKTMNYAQALMHSSNVGMVKLSQMLGDAWPDWLKKFGFTQSTESGLPGEVAGSMQVNTTVDKAMVSYGQGIGVTVWQMLQAYTALSNDGKMLQPRYIEKIFNPNNDKTEKIKTKVVGEPISASTAKQVLNIMVGTGENKVYGTGSDYCLPNYTVSIKTGTAQIFEDGHYTNTRQNFLYSSVQIAPTQDPKYVMYVTMKKPKVSGTNKTEAQAVASIANPLLERALELDPNSQKYRKDSGTTSSLPTRTDTTSRSNNRIGTTASTNNRYNSNNH